MPDPTDPVIEEQPDVVLVRVQVENLDEGSSRALQTNVLQSASTLSERPFVLDLSKVAFMASLSLAALVRIASDFRARNQRLIIAGLQPAVRDLFVLTRVDRLVELHDDVAAALHTIRP